MGKPGEKYRPSNGTEGEGFMSEHCHQCIHERWVHHPDTTGEDGMCKIIIATMGLDMKDPDYPSEWTYDANGDPTCTKWVKFDWGTDDDPREPPPKPEPDDPAQFMMPFSMSELFPFWDDQVVVTKHAIIEREVLEQIQRA